eukprot:13791290-Heterocapsa_arctica.AAC.1
MGGALYYWPVHVGWASSRRVKGNIGEYVPIVIDALVDNPSHSTSSAMLRMCYLRDGFRRMGIKR